MLPTATVDNTTRSYAGRGADLVVPSLQVLADAMVSHATASTVVVSVARLARLRPVSCRAT